MNKPTFVREDQLIKVFIEDEQLRNVLLSEGNVIFSYPGSQIAFRKMPIKSIIDPTNEWKGPNL